MYVLMTHYCLNYKLYIWYVSLYFKPLSTDASFSIQEREHRFIESFNHFLNKVGISEEFGDILIRFGHVALHKLHTAHLHMAK